MIRFTLQRWQYAFYHGSKPRNSYEAVPSVVALMFIEAVVELAIKVAWTLAYGPPHLPRWFSATRPLWFEIGGLLVSSVGAVAFTAWARVAGVDGPMAERWWMRSRYLTVFLAALIGRTLLDAALTITQRSPGQALWVLVDILIIEFWRRNNPGGGRGWDDEIFPIVPNGPEDHTVDEGQLQDQRRAS